MNMNMKELNKETMKLNHLFKLMKIKQIKMTISKSMKTMIMILKKKKIINYLILITENILKYLQKINSM